MQHWSNGQTSLVAAAGKGAGSGLNTGSGRSSFENRIAAASRDEVRRAWPQQRSCTPSPHSWVAHDPPPHRAQQQQSFWNCGGSSGCGAYQNTGGFCQGCGKAWGHWTKAGFRARTHISNSFQNLQDDFEPVKVNPAPVQIAGQTQAPWRRIGKGRGEDKKIEGKGKGRFGGKQASPVTTSGDEEGFNDKPTSGDDMAVDQGQAGEGGDLIKLRGALQACSQAFGDKHDITLQAQQAYQVAWQAKQASVPLHIQLQRTQRKLGQAAKKVEACHSEFEALEQTVKDAVIRMQEVKEQGRRHEGELAAVEAEKAAILQAMQTPAEMGGGGEVATILKGLGPLSLEQLHALGEQIRMACQPLEQTAGPILPANLGEGSTTPPAHKAASSQGVSADRPRSRSPRAGTGPPAEGEFSARDLGLEGVQGQKFDQEQKAAAEAALALHLQQQKKP